MATLIFDKVNFKSLFRVMLETKRVFYNNKGAILQKMITIINAYALKNKALKDKK